eukprot:TRINITY_DN3091_c0_g4_i3.p1 TRINITY_DN3091_c0_g4~~TRINITY_DN3091_c0_g4_i3.p1  ORF type:complete len:1121 (-),score=354.56 TRINITY_DN3091_c0_g4_i3:115-3477(-)
MADSVKVAVRVRPLNAREINADSRCIIDMTGESTTITNPNTEDKRTFTFDHSYWSMDKAEARYASQDTLMNDIGNKLIDNAWKGYNCSIFAYGQTGSGKSYSMMGTEEDPGIIPRICDAIFKEMHEKLATADKVKEETGEEIKYKVEVTYLEIYNEKVKDLLNSTNVNGAHGLKVRENPQVGVYVEDLQSFLVNSYKDMENLIDRGQKTRSVASTQMNATSSRSHSVFTIVFTQTKVNAETMSASDITSKINLVDLAGSERQASTGATGDRLKEGCAINKSLSALGNVISALAESAMSTKKKFIPYRDSVLTRLLQQSLGGNAKTVMIAALSPADINHDETLSTLRYADRAKKIKNNAIINESPNEKLIRELRAEVARLKALLEGAGDVEAMSGLLSEREKMKEELEAQQKLVAQLTMSNAERMEAQGAITAVDTGAGHDLSQPHLVNLHEDPMLAGKVVVPLNRPSTLFGRKKAARTPDYELRGLNIEQEHAEIVMRDGVFSLISSSPTHTFVNGKAADLGKEVTLSDKDRIIFGNNYVFQFINPNSPVEPPEDVVYDFEFARQEQVEASGMLTLLNAEEEADNIATQKIKQAEEEMKKKQQEQEAKLEEERRALQETMAQADAAAQEELKKKQAAMEEQAEKMKQQLEKEMKAFENKKSRHQQRVLLEEQLVAMLRLIAEANAIAKALNEPVVFESKLITSVSHTGHQSTSIGAQMTNTETGVKVVWNRPKFQDRYYMMQELYQSWLEADEAGEEFILLREDDPFYDPPEDTLIGRAQVFLESLSFGIEVDIESTIMDHHGRKCGTLHVEIQPSYEEQGDDDDDDFVEDPEDLKGRQAKYTITVHSAKGLPKGTAAGVYVKYRFFTEEEESVARAQGTKTDNPVFESSTTVDVGFIGETFLDYLREESVVFTVYGHPDLDKLPESPARRLLGSPRGSNPAATLAAKVRGTGSKSPAPSEPQTPGIDTPLTPVAFKQDQPIDSTESAATPAADKAPVPALEIPANDGQGDTVTKSPSSVNMGELTARLTVLEDEKLQISKSMTDLSSEAERLREENQELKTEREKTKTVLEENEDLMNKIKQLEADLQAKDSKMVRLEEDVVRLEDEKKKAKSSACVIS